MNDKELLEFAAKAAGELHLIPYKEEWLTDPLCEAWNPIRFDGDALRLAVKLGLSVHIFHSGYIAVGQTMTPFTKLEIEAEAGDDPYAATRRAIVRAAAEIGKEMK